MKGEQHQEDCNSNQHDEDETNSLTTSNKTQSSKENKAQMENAANHNHYQQHQHATEDQTMKLIIRSPYWGRILKGRPVRNVYTNSTSKNKAPRVISSQAIIYNTDGFWGCCPHHGKRVLEMQECHFSDFVVGFGWDLYLVGTWVSPSHSIHDFFFLPQNQNLVDINRNILLNGWSYVGTCRAEGVRSGLDDMLRTLLQENEITYGHRYHHVHIDIMMDHIFDRETPRSRKINNERARGERKINLSNNTGNSISLGNHQHQESSVTTEGTSSTEQESRPSTVSKASSNANNPFVLKSVGAPPIPRVISNDSSMFSYSAVPHSVANATIAYRDNTWTGDPHSVANATIAYRDNTWTGDYWNTVSNIPSPHHSYSTDGRGGSFVTGSDYHGMYCYPGKGISFAGGLQQQQHPYWHHNMSTIPYMGVTHPPHPPHLLPDSHQHFMMFSEPHIDHLQSFNHHHHQAPPDINADTGTSTGRGYPYIMENTMTDITSKILAASATNITTNNSSLASSPSTLLSTCMTDGTNNIAGELYSVPIVPTPSELLATVTEA